MLQWILDKNKKTKTKTNPLQEVKCGRDNKPPHLHTAALISNGEMKIVNYPYGLWLITE